MRARGVRAEVEPQCEGQSASGAQVEPFRLDCRFASLALQLDPHVCPTNLVDRFQADARTKRQPSDLCTLAARV